MFVLDRTIVMLMCLLLIRTTIMDQLLKAILIEIMICTRNIIQVEVVIRITLNHRVSHHHLGKSSLIHVDLRTETNSFSDYDPYPNYRHDPYGPSNGQAPYRHHSSVASPPQHHGAYPPSHRQQPPLYPSGPSASGAPYPPAPPTGPSHSHYYGAHHRA